MPPGAPGPSMRTLDQVEPRLPIGSGPVELAAAGSYYLTGPVTGTVTIAASDVALDLMGYGVVAAIGPGILLDGPHTNVVIRNGSVTSVSGHGIDATAAVPASMGLIEAVRVRGAGLHGVAVTSGFVVRDCYVQGAADAGIWIGGDAQVLDNLLTGNAVGLQMSTSPMSPAQNARVEGNIVRGNTENYELAAGNAIHLILSELPLVVDVPCKVSLIGDVRMPSTPVEPGITVAANDVTIDLGGFALEGPGSGMESAEAIRQESDWRNLTLMNGTVRDWMGNAVVTHAVEASGFYSRVERLKAVNNRGGVALGLAGIGYRIHAVSNQLDGIATVFECEVRESHAVHNGRDGFVTRASGVVFDSCAAARNGRHGFFLESGGTLRGCVARANAESGFHGDAIRLTDSVAMSNQDGVYITNLDEILGDRLGQGTVLRDNRFAGNYRYGVRLWCHTEVANNMFSRNGFFGPIDGIGLFVEGDGNRISGNTLLRNQVGVEVSGTQNILIGNRVSSSDDVNWIVAASNVCTVVSGMTSGAIIGDAGGAGVGTFDPHVNFTF
jgi:parallel beta-helix repeat protein